MSGRASTTVSLNVPRQQGVEAPAPKRIVIDYGQPHARGRTVVGGVVPFDTVWRTGANEATEFRTDVDLRIGGVTVPKGEYTLYTLPTRSGWKLIINKQTKQWGTTYVPTQDLARIDLKSKRLAEPIESFTIWLIPSPEMPAAGTAPPARGLLKMAWGDVELSTDWAVVQ